jgi:hypothetical protein
MPWMSASDLAVRINRKFRTVHDTSTHMDSSIYLQILEGNYSGMHEHQYPTR